MHRLFAFLLCLITMPAVALDDACTRPKQFTTDKRCYVTAAQKKQKPFSTVVEFISSNNHCTGTIVKGYKEDKNTIYVYTAKHCVADKKNNALQNISVLLQSGRRYTAKLASAGSFNKTFDANWGGDWAIYVINNPAKDIPYTGISDKWGLGGTRPMDARVVGYGALKIMSDKEIDLFQQKYRDFLKKQGQNANAGFSNGGVNTSSTYGTKFVEYLRRSEPKYYRDLFKNLELKISECYYFSTGATYGCQAWGGNSGGPIFDSDGNLMGIHTRGTRIIGGDDHAGRRGLKDITKTKNSHSSVPIAFE